MKKLLILHNSAVSRKVQKHQFYPVNKYHKNKWNMKSALGYYHGYTHFMSVDGTITQTRLLSEEGAHTLGKNKNGHIALCMAGNFSIELPTEKQRESLKKFVEENPDYKPVFHRDLQKNRSCPGKLFTKTLLKNILHPEKLKTPKVEEKKAEEIKSYIQQLDTLKEILKDLLALIFRYHA